MKLSGKFALQKIKIKLHRRQFLHLALTVMTLLLITIIGGLTHISPSIAQRPQQITLTVSAGAGLKPVLDEIQKLYKQKQPQHKINYNFAASGALTRQIEQGANIDIFISASSRNMDELQNQGMLLAETRRNLIKSRVALIAPVSSTGISRFQDLTKPIVKRIAIGEPRSVPLGVYAEEVFQHLGILEQLKPKLVYTRSALEILNFVAAGNVEVGIVHDTTARTSDKVKILAIAPEASHSPVVYPVAVLKNTKNPTAAKSFVEFLFSEQAKTLYTNYGYTIVQS
ncbi:molybdate ABC transporter substrate-binding protein [Anabaena sp. CCY 0017]|uniref:molybdate ABC transporter substrate-binding protein n=1 Tax=Anabaena sp. CCY 0017 TaxID=3103866 RepID=UPI0039C5D139